MIGKQYRLLIYITLLLLIAIPILAQNLPQPTPQASLVAYQCEFDRNTNSAIIRSSLTGIDGLPIPRDAYNVDVQVIDTGQPVAPALVQTTMVAERPPLQMILVLDATDTVPIESLVNAVSARLMPQLEVQDRVALITFAEDIAPRTQFYTDKGRLVNEHMVDLRPLEGDNRLYDAIFDAVTEFPAGNDSRKVVFAITDSNRRDIDQISLEEIVNRAEREHVQIFAVGFNSGADAPDVPELSQLVNSTGGYLWVWDESLITRDAIEQGVSDYIDEFIDTLNSEIITTINLEGQRPDPNGFVNFQMNVVTNNEDNLSDQIACPVEELTHSISFLGTIEDGTVRGPIDIGVDVETELDPSDVVPVFIVNDDVVQDTGDLIYRFNEPAAQPGYYSIRAELRNRSGEVLATTDREIQLYVQGDVNLDIAGGYFGSLEGEVVIEVSTNPEFDLPGVIFTIAEKSNPEDKRTLTQNPVPFTNGIASLSIPNIRETVEGAFPDTDEETFILAADVQGVSSNDPDQAISNEFEVTIPKPPPAPVVNVELPNFNGTLFNWLVLLILFIVNILLFRAVGRARIRRIINNPDHFELSPQLMSVTVRREGIKQTHTLTKKTITIGRGSSNDINLGDDPNISRQHGVIMWRDERWYYSNRKRRAVTRINGKRKVGLVMQKLVPIAEIEIGAALLIFHSNAQQDVSEFIKTNL